ncbi:beta-ketoacyl [acyl carrier protein] synthase domain-containing protein, partial [Streptomyces rubiginosohelvolus]
MSTVADSPWHHDVHDSVAVIGFSCRLPGARTPEEFWRLLSEGADAVTSVPEDRWTPRQSDGGSGARAEAGTPARLAQGRTGVFVGAVNDDYATLLRRHGGDSAVTHHTLTGLQRGMIANRVSYALGLSGPSMTVDTAQSSSLVAVHLACESLRRGECTSALVGG